jgi:diguanylate cyclase (GGDEF)-like protein/PAS domain S-box-containing protein
MSAAAFLRQFRIYVLLTWTIPPVFGLSFIIFINLLTATQVLTLLTTPLEPIFILGSLVFALWYLNRFVRPIAAWLADPQPAVAAAELALGRIRRFPLVYWGVFLTYLVLAPSSVILSAQLYTGYEPQPVDWFRIHLVALIVSIIVGLPIFFRILDLFGRVLGGLPFKRAHLTIKTKVFLIGALVPLLLDTMLVQYYWTRTGYFTSETFVMWLVLELLAVGGSLIFVRSFGQSLAPLQRRFTHASNLGMPETAALVPQSTDELGVLTSEFRGLIERLREGEENLRSLAENANDGILVHVDGRVVFANRRLAELLSYDLRELLARTVADIVPPVERSKIETRYRARLRGEPVPGQYETAALTRDGAEVPIEISVAPTRWQGQQALIVVIRDITSRRAAEEALRSEKERAQVTLASIGDGVITTDVTGRIDYLNPVAEQLTGWDVDETRARPLTDVFQLIHEATRQPLENPVARCLRDGRITGFTEHSLLIRRDGREFAIEHSAAPILNRTGEITGVVLAFSDVTANRAMARQINFQASHDSLTGLINRREFESRLEAALASARAGEGPHGLCYLDLDQFKIVNDTCGHIAGDELLRQLASHLLTRVRDTDTVARLGGDEFGVLLERCSLDEAQNIADGLRHAVRDFRFVWDERVYEVGVSIGLVPIVTESGSLTDVLSAADSACYVAKDHGRNRIHLYQPDDKILAQRHGEMQWVSRLTQAFEENRFLLYYQPIQPLMAREPGAPFCEILLRMWDEQGQLVLPPAFLPAAERYNLMPTIDRWVVRRTLALLEAGRSPFQHPDSTCSINLSGQTLGDAQFLDFVVDQIDHHGVNPARICFEVTETAAIANLTGALRFIMILRGMGCRFALDDFGSGLSSFAYLKALQVDYLKIAGNFVRTMAENPIDHAMVESINQIGHVMGIKTVAEDVENRAILAKLETLGVDYAQGSETGRPVQVG